MQRVRLQRWLDFSLKHTWPQKFAHSEWPSSWAIDALTSFSQIEALENYWWAVLENAQYRH
jgi:hypothetical protein